MKFDTSNRAQRRVENGLPRVDIGFGFLRCTRCGHTCGHGNSEAVILHRLSRDMVFVTTVICDDCLIDLEDLSGKVIKDQASLLDAVASSPDDVDRNIAYLIGAFDDTTKATRKL